MAQTAEPLYEPLPGSNELWSDEPQMESTLHFLQLQILVTALQWHWRDRKDYFIGANLSVYYNPNIQGYREFCGPDFFLVRGVSGHPRRSWAVWSEEGRYPDLIIEILSGSTANTDRFEKKRLYQNRFRTPEYFWFSPDTLEFKGHRLVRGSYQNISKNEDGQCWSHSLGLYLGVENKQLRYFSKAGQLILLPEEVAREKMQEAQQARHEAQQAQEQAKRLIEQLRQLGIEPE